MALVTHLGFVGPSEKSNFARGLGTYPSFQSQGQGQGNDYTFNRVNTFNRIVNTLNQVVNTFNRVANSFYRFLNIFFRLMLNTFNT